MSEANHNYYDDGRPNGRERKAGRGDADATRAQLEQAKATLWRDQTDHDRMQKLFDSGVESAQDRDHAEATLNARRRT